MKFLLLLLTISEANAYDDTLIDGYVQHRTYRHPWENAKVIVTAGNLETRNEYYKQISDNSFSATIEKMVSPDAAFSFIGTTANFKPKYYFQSEETHIRSLGMGVKFFFGGRYFAPFIQLGASHYWNTNLIRSKTIRGFGAFGLHLMLGETLGIYGDIKSIHPISQLSGDIDKVRLFSTNFGLIVQI